MQMKMAEEEIRKISPFPIISYNKTYLGGNSNQAMERHI